MFKRHYIALAIVVILTLVILNLPSGTAARLKLAVGGLFVPLFGLASTTEQLGDRAIDSLTPRSKLLEENEALRREISRLQLEKMQTQHQARENAHLRQLVGWQQQTPWRLKLGNVVLRDPANWWRTVQIDLGSRDGLRKNLPVLTTNGLVGRVDQVGLTRSQVVLLGDPNCQVFALVENDAHDTGGLATADPFDNSLIALQFLSRNANLKPGQNVTTSGLGGIFPKGIPIGKIVDTRLVDGLYLEARVKLAANLSGLEEVWVLMP